MKRVLYPDINIIDYIQKYKDVYSREIVSMQNDWQAIYAAYPQLAFLPTQIDDIVVADFAMLVSWFIQYKSLSNAERDTLNIKLASLFNYDGWSSEISEYFKEPQNGFNISTCHYCDTSYINVFEVEPIGDALYFLNTATQEEIHKKLNVADSSAKYLISQRPFHSRADFDKVASKKRWSIDKFEKVFRPNYKYRHHFDLDHVLPKSVCPFVALSLFNFVPSCQICNQKLKKTKVLGHMGIPLDKLSPTSSAFDFNSSVKFTVIPKNGSKIGARPVAHPENFVLKLYSNDPDYNIFIKLFKLDERYDYHKRIALKWLDLKIKYSDARIYLMANALHHPSFSFRRIKDDIFQNDLYNDGKMPFTKLRKDMLG